MIRLENIYKYYYSESSVTQALRNVNLEFSKGEFVAITGESGSGKTTLLNVLTVLPYYLNHCIQPLINTVWFLQSLSHCFFIYQFPKPIWTQKKCLKSIFIYNLRTIILFSLPWTTYNPQQFIPVFMPSDFFLL